MRADIVDGKCFLGGFFVNHGTGLVHCALCVTLQGEMWTYIE